MFRKKASVAVPEVVTEPVPPKAELEKMYIALLEELAIPEAKRDAMIQNEPDANKWKLIRAHRTMAQAKTGKNIKTNEPLYWVGVLEATDGQGNPVLTPEKAQELETVLRTGHKQFLLDFVNGDGVQSLLNATSWFSNRDPMTDSERLIVHRLMESYKCLMNNAIGMEGMLSKENAFSILALSMGLGGMNTKLMNLTLAKEAVLLLAVTCFYSAKGRNMVVQAMDELRRRWRESSRFESLVRCFRTAQAQPDFRAACAMFITTIVNSAPSVDGRVKVRNDFIALDILEAFRQAVAESPEGDENSFIISTQLQVFEDMMVSDHAEVIHSMLGRGNSGDEDYAPNGDDVLDLSDQDAVFKELSRASKLAGTPDLLLEVTQSLLLIPTERVLAQPVWAGIAQFVGEATSNAVMGKRRSQKMIKLNYGVLHQILEERLKLDKNLQALASSDEVVVRQRKKIDELSKQLAEPRGGAEMATNKALEEELKLARDKIATLQAEVDALKSRLFEEQKKVAAAQEATAAAVATAVAKAGTTSSSSVASAAAPVAVAAAVAAAAPAAGGAANVDPKYAKYYRMKKAGLPEGAIMQAMARDNVPVPPGFFDEDGGSASTPAAAAPPPRATTASASTSTAPTTSAASAAAAAAAAAAAKPKGPQKPVIKPNVKMRGLFWTKIQPDQLEGTVWKELKDDKVKLEIAVLESKFQAIEAKAAAPSPGDGKGSAHSAAHREKVHIIDGKRQQNVGIGISKLRSTPQETVAAIIKIDDTALTLERAKLLVDMAPTDDEISLLRGYDGDLEMLTTEDRFLYEMTNVPRLATRLKSLVVRHTFEKEALELKAKLVAIREACIEVEKSKSLKTCLEIVLAIGNYLNGSTPRGGAWGFKLDALDKLEAVKENDGKKTLLHYLVYVLEKNYPNVLETFELPKTEVATHISISEAHNDMRNLATQVRMIKNELAAEHSDRADRFVAVFSSFQLKAEKQVQELEVEFQIVLEDFQNLAQRYGETGPKVEPAILFGAFSKFQLAVKHAHDSITQARERDAKLKAVEEEKRRRATLKKKDADGGVVDAFQKANMGDADQIVQGFRQRHRAASVEEKW